MTGGVHTEDSVLLKDSAVAKTEKQPISVSVQQTTQQTYTTGSGSSGSGSSSGGGY